MPSAIRKFSPCQSRANVVSDPRNDVWPTWSTKSRHAPRINRQAPAAGDPSPRRFIALVSSVRICCTDCTTWSGCSHMQPTNNARLSSRNVRSYRTIERSVSCGLKLIPKPNADRPPSLLNKLFDVSLAFFSDIKFSRPLKLPRVAPSLLMLSQ